MEELSTNTNSLQLRIVEAENIYGVTGVQQSFRHKNEVYWYLKFLGDKPPPPELGRTGDIYLEICGNQTWTNVSSEHGWSKAVEGNPVPHPSLKAGRVLDLETQTWISTQAIRMRRHREHRCGAEALTASKIDKNYDEIYPLNKAKSGSFGSHCVRHRLPGQELSEVRLKRLQSGVSSKTSEPVSICPQNNWICPLLLKWTSPPICNFPFSQPGRIVLESLSQLEEPLILDSQMVEMDYDIMPQLSHVVTDLVTLNKEEQSGMDSIDYSRSEYIFARPVQIVASIMESTWITDWSDPANRCFSALSVPMKTAGLGSCGLKLPTSLMENSVVMLQGKGKNKMTSFSTTLSPAGAITHPHLDFHGSTQVMFHITGEKVWLIWPPTPKNLHWYGRYRDQPVFENRTLEAIHQLEHIKVLHVWKPGHGFIIPPYGIHAVLSLSTSSHTGTKLWGYDWFDQAHVGLEIDIEWTANPEQYGFGVDSALGRLREIDEELKQWNRLTKEWPDHPRRTEVDLKVIKMENKVNAMIHRLRKGGTLSVL